MADISKYDDLIDSRDVIARIDELESEIADLKEQLEELEDDEDNELPEECEALNAEIETLEEELAPLQSLAEEASGYSSDWRYGETLIADSYFTEYAQEMAEEIGAIDPNAGWPSQHIDWDAAADELKQDYTCVDFDGAEFWIRSC